jgi:hypothetical protein
MERMTFSSLEENISITPGFSRVDDETVRKTV